MSKVKRLSLCGSARLSGPYTLIGRQDKSALSSQSSTAARSFVSPRRAGACAGKANSHVVVKDADVHGLDELRAARRAVPKTYIADKRYDARLTMAFWEGSTLTIVTAAAPALWRTEKSVPVSEHSLHPQRPSPVSEGFAPPRWREH